CAARLDLNFQGVYAIVVSFAFIKGKPEAVTGGQAADDSLNRACKFLRAADSFYFTAGLFSVIGDCMKAYSHQWRHDGTREVYTFIRESSFYHHTADGDTGVD